MLFRSPAVRLLAKRGAMRGAHQAFFLDDDKKTRAAELLRRVEETKRVPKGSATV